MDAKNRKLPSSMISIIEEKSKTAAHSEGGDEEEVRRAETREVAVKVDEEKMTMVSKGVETKSINKVRKKKT